MADRSRGKKVGRPRKYAGGWESANRRICISNKTYERWREVKERQCLRSDDSVAQYLLLCDESRAFTTKQQSNSER